MAARYAPSLPITQGIARRVAKLRAKRGWRQLDLADRAGLSRGMVSTIENGLKAPGLQVLYDLARAFGVEVVDLLPTVRDTRGEQLDLLRPKRGGTRRKGQPA